MKASACPRLKRHARLRWDRHEHAHFLLAPERGFRLSTSAATVLLLCDGERSVLEIARAAAPERRDGESVPDVLGLLDELDRRGLLEVREP